MNPPRKPASGEKGKTRPGLTREAIVSAALEIVDREGLQALSMRHLGSVLEVDPMAIYYHIPNKSALLDALMEAVMGEIDLTLDDPSLPSSERIRVAAHMYRGVMMAHPHAVEVIAVRNLNTPESFRPVEFLLGVFLEAGFSHSGAFAAVNIFARFVRGFVLSEVQQLAAAEIACNGCGPMDELREVLPVEEFPRMYEIMAAVGPPGCQDEFDLGVRALINGMFEIFSENGVRNSEIKGKTSKNDEQIEESD
ncbi:MAG: TetR/AcrR family transcriptional regulator [Thermoleophilia bacterium]